MQSSRRRIINIILIWVWVIALSAGLLYWGLRKTDEYLAQNALPDQLKVNAMSGIVQLDLYPYTGWHVQSNYHQQGDIPRELQPYHDYDVTTGDMGFFDFKLQESYPKAPEEFRIVLIGGSGAQGWGAQSNDQMMYRLLPKYLNERLAGCGVNATLVNLAMGASTSYQNYIALNRWGHPLQPDLILSYSGRNDVVVPFTIESDGFWLFPPLNGLVLSLYPKEGRGWVKWLSDHFPNLTDSRGIGAGLRLIKDYPHYIKEANRRYAENTHSILGDPNAFLENIVKPQYRHAFMSIKRDFEGVPIAIAWQAVRDEEWTWQNKAAALNKDFYSQWFAQLPHELEHYMNDQWYFFDANAYMQQFPEQNTGTHLGNAGQDILARWLADQLAPVIKTLRQKNCQAGD